MKSSRLIYSSLAAVAALGGLYGLARAGAATPAATGVEPVATGKFAPSWDSLRQYQTPEWFRDAKFGIWAHWTAQCVPEQGDWYARNMYPEYTVDKNTAKKKLNPVHAYHVEHYGHPSKFGFKDIDNIWHAEKW